MTTQIKGQGKRIKDHNRREEFWGTFLAMREDPEILKLQQYPNHRISNLYDHSSRVALCAYDLSRRFHIKVDGAALARGAMLHDYYLYHAQSYKKITYRPHLLGHPQTALSNAKEHFELTKKEENIIESHMWPMTPTRIPKSKEAFLVQLADKFCAFGEGVMKNTAVRQEKYEALAEKRAYRLLQKEEKTREKYKHHRYILL